MTAEARIDSTTCIVWFRRDLRLADHPALARALAVHDVVIPLYILERDAADPWPPGAAARWWLHHSLESLDGRLQGRGSRLILRSGPPLEVLRAVIAETGASAVYWNRRYSPAEIRRDAEVKAGLKRFGIDTQSFAGALLHEPWTVMNQSGKPYQVFTPFWKRCLAQPSPPAARPAPPHIPSPAKEPPAEPLASWRLLPRVDWAAGLRANWRPGEPGAAAALNAFLSGPLSDYREWRDVPAVEGTSRLSPHLHFGEISPRTLWHVCAEAAEREPRPTLIHASNAYLRQVIWREFAHHLLYHFPDTPTRPLRPSFEEFPWRADETLLCAWREGRTGYPLVDAGMRELWATGWMHNRIRMVVASFLVKHLLIHWVNGARWFWDTLVDADLANNTLGWQWAAGCGADAAPYFRIFNPVRQGRRFDPSGTYVRKWVPELQALPDAYVHQPFNAPADVLLHAGVRLGESYPRPVVDHAAGRARALEALASISQPAS